eukprot:s1524_g16.t1
MVKMMQGRHRVLPGIEALQDELQALYVTVGLNPTVKVLSDQAWSLRYLLGVLKGHNFCLWPLCFHGDLNARQGAWPGKDETLRRLLTEWGFDVVNWTKAGDSAATSPSLSEKSGCKDNSAQLKVAKSAETPGTTPVRTATMSSDPPDGTPAVAGTVQRLGEDEESLVQLALKRRWEFQKNTDRTSLNAYAAEAPGAALLPAVKTENAALEADLSAAITAVQESLDTPDFDTGDLRRKQLTMRADEQQKAADKKEESKKRKAEEQKAEPRPKGRPRKQFLAQNQDLQDGASAPASTVAAAADPPHKRRRANGQRREEGTSTAPPEVAPVPSGESSAARPKAAAKGAAKSRPKAKAHSRRGQAAQQQEEVSVNEADKLEMQAILVRLQGAKYDKEAETLHKGKFEGVQISVYWTRCAVGVKILDATGRKWKQVQYFSEEPLCLRILQAAKFAAELEKHLPENPDWAETAEGIRFVRVLRLTAAAALAAHHRV